MKKRLLSLILALVMVLSLLPVSAAAEELGFGEDLGFGEATDPSGITWSVEVNGTDGYSTYYTLTIGGSGPMDDYTYDESIYDYTTPWAEYAYYVTQVVISDGVTSIGTDAFARMYYLEKVTIGKDVASISDGVFAECSYLAAIEVSAENTTYCAQDNVLFNKDKSELIQYAVGSARTSYTVPGTVKVIGSRAFAGAGNLTSVSLPDGLQVIGDYAFRYAAITAVNIPNTVTEIGEEAFYRTGLTSVTIPDSVTTVGARAFSSIYSLEKVHIGSGLTNMGEAVFLYSDSITEITVDADNAAYCAHDNVLFNKEKTELILYAPTKEQSAYEIPDGVTLIDDYAFYSCDQLTSVTFPASLKTINDYAFQSCSGLTSVVLPQGLETIGDGAFYYCRYLAEADLPDSLTGLGAYAFGNTALTAAVIPDGVTTIGASAFADVPLTEVTIGSGVTEIEERAFSACTSLTTVNFLGDAPEVGELAFSSVRATCYYPQNNATWTAAAMEKFGNANLIWEMITYEVASGTCGDGVSWLLTDNGVLTVSGTGAMAFDSSPWQSYSNQIRKVVVEDGVTAIADGAFDFYSNLTEVVLADTVVTIGKGAFRRCVSLKEVDLGDGVTNIGAEAFLECVSLEKVILPNDGTYLGSQAFAGCSSLTEIYILGEARESDDYAIDVFTNVSATVYYTSSSWNTLHSGFEGNLYWVKLTAYGTCGDDVFWHLDDTVLTIFGTGPMYHYSTWESDLAPWSAYKNQITLVNVEDGVTSVGGSSFYSCSALTTVYLADSVTIIAVGAFRGCSALKNLTIPANVTAINDNSFQNCTALTDVTIPAGVTSIGESAFRECDGLTTVSIPEKVSNISIYAFYGCNKLTEIEFLGDAPSIGYYAFYNVKATVNYPADNDTWTDSVKQNYGGTLTWVAAEEPENSCGESVTWSLEDGVLTISGTGPMENYVFDEDNWSWNTPWKEYESYITQVVIEDGVTSIGDTSFFCFERLESVTIPDSVVSIGAHAFQYSALSEITIPDGVTTIGAHAFEYVSLQEICIPDSVTAIGEAAFLDTWCLESVTIGSGMESIGADAFKYCSNLTSVTFEGDAPTIGTNAFCDAGTSSGTTCYYPAGNSTWTSDVMQDYGGTLTWVKVGGDEEAPVVSSLTEEDEDNICTGGFTKIYVTATDAVGVTGIKLTYAPQGGQAVEFATLTGSGAAAWDAVATWDVADLSDGAYTVTAVAYDAAGNESQSVSITVTVDKVKPVLTALRVVNADGDSRFGGKNNKAFLSVSGTNLGSSDTVTVSISGKNMAQELTFAANQTCELDLSDWESGTYTLNAAVCDGEGNTDTLDAGVSITVDNTAPPAPDADALNVIASALKNTLSWNRSTETGARSAVYRAVSETGQRTLLTVVNNNDVNQSWVDTAVEVGVTYYYWVAAQDALGNESAAAGPVSATALADETLPWVSAISPVNGSTLNGTASITITAEDNIGVRSVALACSTDGKNWTEIGAVEAARGTFAVDTTRYGETLYLRITVVDLSGQEYINSETYSYTIDNTPPEQVTGLTSAATSTVITLNWNDVAAQDFSHFVVEQKQSDGSYKQIKTVSDALGVYVTGLTPSTAYTFRVYAVDKLGNKGEVSEEYTVTTAADTTAPVITNIRPGPGRYSGDAAIALTFTVADDYGVGSLSVQTSYDGTDWTTVDTVTVNEVGTSVQVKCTLSTAGFAEGVLYVRAVAVDKSGNKGDDSSSAPYTQYHIDRTVPAAPTGLNAEAGEGYISLTWAQGSEDDLNTYTVYRAEGDGAFAAIASGLKRLYLVDTNVAVGTTYYYRIDVTDVAGNRSGMSDMVSAVPLADSEAPKIVSVSPTAGYIMGPSTAIQVKVSDNQKVAALYYQISTDDGANWTNAASIAVNAAEKVVGLPLVQKDLTVNAFLVKFWCVDATGNRSEPVERSYALDRTAPHAPAITATAGNMAIQLSWVGNTVDSDLSGYRVYRSENGGGYKLLFQRGGGQENYSYTDSNVSVNRAYSYYIEAVDTRGNTASGTASASVYPLNVDTAPPTAVLDGAVSAATGYEVSFNAGRSVDNVGVVAYHWEFSDDFTADTAAVNHAFASAGTYTVTVTVYDAAGYSDSDTMTVTVRDPEQVGSLTIQVKDESGQVVPNAGIYMDLGGENQSLLYTNSMGVINLRPTAGVHVIGVYTDGYLPAKTTVNVVAGRSETVTVNVVQKDIVVGELTVERMTLEQIKAAGIDVSDPANQFVYEFNIQLTYGTYEAYVSAQYNGEGQPLKNPDPVEVIDSNGETRYLDIHVIPVRTGGGNGTDSGTGGVGPGAQEQEVPMVVIMDIPGKASWLKDFFDVRLTVINQAESQFVLDDALAYLNVPAGLTLMETVYTKAEASYSMGSIAGGTSQTAHWVLRGDVGGEYDLTADFSAVLRDFGTKISAQFQTDEPFRVRQGDGLTLDVVVENAILADTDGAIKVGLRNDDEFPYYLPNLALDPELVTLTGTYKTNGRVKVDTDRDTLKTGETIWWEYVVPRANWETLTTYSDQDFYLMEAIVESIGGNAELPYTIEEVMPFSINGDRIVVTRVSSGGGESAVSYLNVDKANAISAVIPDLMIRTYRKNDAGEYVPASMKITIKDGYVMDKGGDDAKDGITVTTNSEGEYTYKGYSMTMLGNDKAYNIRISASRAHPVDIPVVIRGETAETGLLTVYTYAGSGDEITVLEGATVTLREVNGIGTEDVTDTTDEDGKAGFEKVPQGKQELLIEKEGYLPLTAVVDVGSDTEVSYRLYTDDDPGASRIIQIKNDLSGWGTGNQTIFPEGRVDGKVGFQLTKRVAEGEEFERYHYRITDKDGALVKTETFDTDDGFWLELKDLKAGYKLEFAVETDNGISPYMDSNLIVTADPGFFGDLIYDLTTLQMGGKVDFTKGLEFDPSKFIEDFSASRITEGVAVKDDEKGYQAEAIEQTNTYSFTKVESKQIYPVSAKYDLSGKLTLSVILGGEKESTTVSGGSYSAAVYEQTPDHVSYRGVVAIGEEKESDKKSVSGQLQADFVFQYDPARNDWSLAVYGKINAEQSFTLLEASFLKVGYASVDLKFEESATLELVRSDVGPEEKIEVLGNGLIPKEMKAGGELKTAVGAKAVSKKVASVGAYLKVGLEFQLLPYLALRANAALGAEGSVLIWSKSKDLISETWEFSGDAEPAALATFALYDLRSNPVDTLSLASAPARTWRRVADAWITGAYEQAEPQLVTLNDGRILAVWCGYTDDANGPVALYWSVYENDEWSEPVRVDSDGTADLYPSLIVTDKAVQLVWVDFKGSVAEMDNLTYAEIEAQAFKMLGVTTASFTGNDWNVTETYEGGTLAANPKVAVGADGSVLVAWIANEGNLEEATAAKPDHISWVLLDGETMTSGSIAAPAATIVDLGVGCGVAGYRLAALAENADGMLKLYHAEMENGAWNDLTAASSIDSADSAMDVAGDGTVYTINSGRIYTYADGAYRQLLRSDLLGEDAGQLTCVETAQGTVLLWTATLGSDSAVCMTLVDKNGKASQPVVIDSSAEGILSAPTAAADASGLTVLYQHASAADGIWNHDLLMKRFVMDEDLSLEDSLIRHSGYLVPGAYLESYVEVESLGVVIPDSYAVEVYYVDETGKQTVIGEEPGNSSMNLTVKWTVPETYAGEPMYFRVVSEDDGNPTNDTVQLGNLIRELAVSDPVYVGLLDGKDVFTVDVENQGLVTSEKTTLTLSLIGGDGALHTVTVDALEPGAKRTIRLELTGLERTEDLSLVFAAAALTGEGDLANNNEYLILPAIEAGASIVTADGTKYYASLSEALMDAQAGDTVRLQQDGMEEGSLHIIPDVTLDLNGHYVEAENILSFGQIVDDAATAGGIVISNDRAKAFVLMQADNRCLPIYDTTYSAESGCYRFYDYSVENLGGREAGPNAVKFGIRIRFDNAEAYKVLSETADSDVDLLTVLNWGADLEYTFNAATVKEFGRQVYADLTESGSTGKAITLTVSGLDALAEGTVLSSLPTVESVTGTVGRGEKAEYSADTAKD